MFRNFLLAVAVFLGICFARPHNTPPSVPAAPSRPIPHCPCGCEQGGVCTCANCPIHHPPAPPPQPSVQVWRTDYSQARDDAVRLNKPMFTYVSSAQCAYCPMMDARLAQREVTSLLTDYVCVKIKYEDYKYVVDFLELQSFPAYVITNSANELTVIQNGLVSVETVQKDIQRSQSAPPIPSKPVAAPPQLPVTYFRPTFFPKMAACVGSH